MRLPQQFITFLQTSNLVSIKNHLEFPNLYVAKYKTKVFYNDLWNSNLEICRGLVFSQEYEIISLPFTKIYNFGFEKNCPKLDAQQKVTAWRKFNGFMAAITSYNGEILVSTTGSLTSPYVVLAKSLITEEIIQEVLVNPSYTYLYEVIDSSDPHIIKEEASGLVCLGRRLKQLDSPIEFAEAYLHPAVWASKMEISLSNLIALSKEVKHEGFVFYVEKDGKQLASKLKSRYYLITKFLARTNQTISKQKLSKYENAEEFYGIIDQINSSIGTEAFLNLDEQSRIAFVENYFISN